MLKRVHLDFETRSACDLKKAGAAIYSEDPTTDILCVAYCVDDEQRDVYAAQDVFDLHYLKYYASCPDYIFIAHNAFFEQCIWQEIMVKRYGFKPIPLDRWRCTMAKCYAHGLPGALDRAAAFLGLDARKEDSAAMKKLSAPKGWFCSEHGQSKFDKKKPPCCSAAEIMFWTEEECPKEFTELYSYCQQDVEVERQLDKSLRDLNPKSERIWQIYMKMNHEGIALDMPAISNACAFIEQQKQITRHDFQAASKTEYNPTQRGKLKEWLNDKGVETKDTKKATLDKLLTIRGLSDDIAEVIALSRSGNKSSLAKYPQMLKRQKNGILREYIQFHGAHTGRPTGKGVQLLNLARPKINSDISSECLRDLDFESFSWLYPQVNDAISYSTRGMLIARPGRRFIVADLRQIETVKLAWLAGQLNTLEDFKAGKDLYCIAASPIFGRVITKADDYERQLGKILYLAFQFGGGIGACGQWVKIYNIDIMWLFNRLKDSVTDSEWDVAKYCLRWYKGRAVEPMEDNAAMICDVLKQRFRKANPHIVSYWARLQDNATAAILHPGKRYEHDGLVWVKKGKFLFCKLPSGRLLAYLKPLAHPTGKGKYDLSYMSVRGRRSLYGGKISENVTQGSAHDVIEEGILRFPDYYDLRLDVYDEVVLEVDDDKGSCEEVAQLLTINADWNMGLPLSCEVFESKRYRK